MNAAKIISILLTLAAAVPGCCDEIFQYTDRNGTIVFVDDATKVPRESLKLALVRHHEPTGEHCTKITLDEHLVYVPVTISYRGVTVAARFLLDTGASSTMITGEMAQTLGAGSNDLDTGQARVADGRFVRTGRLRLESLRLDTVRKDNLEVGILPVTGPPLPFDGLLGMNFLGETGYRLKMNRQVICWGE